MNPTCYRLSSSEESHSLLGEKQEKLEMEILKQILRICGFVLMKCDTIHEYLGFYIVTFRKQIMGTALLIKEMSGNPLHL